MDECQKPRANVLISESDMENWLTDIVKDLIEDKYDLKTTKTIYADELMKLTRHHTFDLYVLFLNNIIFPSVNLPAESRIKKALWLVTHLKAKYKKPIIGLYGWPNNLTFRRQAKKAGADFVFQVPCPIDSFKEAIEKCLEECNSSIS